MKTQAPLTEAEADAVIEHALTGKLLEPELARRVREQSERATAELRQRYGTLNVDVALIREAREEE